MAASYINWRRDTLANWLAENPVLADGEPVLVASDPAQPKKYNYFCCGNGIDTFDKLPLNNLDQSSLDGGYFPE